MVTTVSSTVIRLSQRNTATIHLTNDTGTIITNVSGTTNMAITGLPYMATAHGGLVTCHQVFRRIFIALQNGRFER